MVAFSAAAAAASLTMLLMPALSWAQVAPPVDAGRLRSVAARSPPRLESGTSAVVQLPAQSEFWRVVSCAAAGQAGSVAFSDGRLTHTWFCAEGLNRDCPDGAAEAPYVKLKLFNAGGQLLAESTDANAPLPSFVCRAAGPLYLQVADYYGGGGTVGLQLTLPPPPAAAASQGNPISTGNAECWSGAYTATRCCDVASGPTGDVSCWSGSFGFEFCCPPPGGSASTEPGGEASSSSQQAVPELVLAGGAAATVEFELACSWTGLRHTISCETTVDDAPLGGTGGVPLRLTGAQPGTAYSVTATQVGGNGVAVELQLLPAEAMAEAGAAAGQSGWTTMALAPAGQHWSETPVGHQSLWDFAAQETAGGNTGPERFDAAAYLGSAYRRPAEGTPSTSVWPCAAAGDWLLILVANCDIPGVSDFHDSDGSSFGDSAFNSEAGRQCAARWSIEVTPAATVSATVELPPGTADDPAALDEAVQQLAKTMGSEGDVRGTEMFAAVTDISVEKIGPTTAAVSVHVRDAAAATALQEQPELSAQLIQMFAPEGGGAAPAEMVSLAVGEEGYSQRHTISLEGQPSCVLDAGSQCQADLLAMFSVQQVLPRTPNQHDNLVFCMSWCADFECRVTQPPHTAFPISIVRATGGGGQWHRRGLQAVGTTSVELTVGVRALTAEDAGEVLGRLTAAGQGRRLLLGSSQDEEVIAALRAENRRLRAENARLLAAMEE